MSLRKVIAESYKRYQQRSQPAYFRRVCDLCGRRSCYYWGKNVVCRDHVYTLKDSLQVSNDRLTAQYDAYADKFGKRSR